MISIIEREIGLLQEQARSQHVLLTDIFEQLGIALPPEKASNDEVAPSVSGSMRLQGVSGLLNELGYMHDRNMVLARVLRDVLGYDEPPIENTTALPDEEMKKEYYDRATLGSAHSVVRDR